MTWVQFLAIMIARRWALIIIFTLVAGGIIGGSFLWPRQYTAETQVVIDMKPDPIAGVVFPSMLTPGFLVTQVDIVMNPRLALMVVDRLGIARDPIAIQQFRDEYDGRGSIRQYYATLLQKKLEVKPSRESSVINLAFTGADPAFAASVVNAFAQAYVDTNIAMRVEPARQQRQWFEQQATVLRGRLDEAQTRLGDYLRSNEIVSLDERLDVETSRLQELSSQLVLVRSQEVDASNRSQQARRLLASGNANELPDALQNPLIQQLKASQATLEGRLKEQQAVYGDQHPFILRLREEMRAVQGRVQSELETLAASLSRAHTVTAQRVRDQAAAVEAQRVRVLDLKGNRDSLTGLQRDVDHAQAAFDAVGQRLMQSGLESQASQANLFILNPAEAPNEHATPHLLLNSIVAVLLGIVLAIGTVLIHELLRRRIRSADDLALAVPAPVIGQIQGARGRSLLQRKGSARRLLARAWSDDARTETGSGEQPA